MTSVSVSPANSTDVVTCEWGGNGRAKLLGLDKVPLSTWDYRRTALRQEEVAEFIRSTKAEKYSALVPLLGLQPLETVAENLRRIAREMVTLSKIEDLRRSVAAVSVRRKTVFGPADDAEVFATIRSLSERYLCSGDTDQSTFDDKGVIQAALKNIDTRLNSLDAQSREAAGLQSIAANGLAEAILEARKIIGDIAEVAEPLVKERLDILTAAAAYRTGVAVEEGVLACPACGTSVNAEDFGEHVASERTRLQHIDALFGRQAEAIASVCDEAARMRTAVMSPNLANWREKNALLLQNPFDVLRSMNFSTLRTRCQEQELAEIEANFRPVTEASQASDRAASPDVQILIRDKECFEAGLAIIEAGSQRAAIHRIEGLLAFTGKLEELVREEIREQAQQVFRTISGQIQRLWDLLYPGHQIDQVRLHVPEEVDKAIDVALKFYGVAQESPRLTLSEGQRNALGLCIFLAMAKQDTSGRPIILDDVVVSMDRDHRSQVAALLEKEFGDRQVILLTHDREWFFELSRFLKKPRWTSAKLMPWASPTIGIRVAEQASDFANARANVGSNPEDAESNVRRIMDQGMAEIAERLEVPMPFLRGDENDHRTAGQFISRIAGRARSSFKVRSPPDPVTRAVTYEKNATAVRALEAVIPQLAVWANRATHTFSASATEAGVVVDNCEAALGVFECDECDTFVWHCSITDTANLECRCGKLQWRT